MESYSVKAILSAVDRGYTSKMKSAASLLEEIENQNKRTSSSMMDIAKGAGVFRVVEAAISKLEASAGDAVDRFDTMTRFPKVMEQMGFSADVSNRSIKKLSDGIKGLPTSLDGIVSSTQRIAVLTGDLEKATDTSLALNNAFLASGSASADAERGLVQYTQMLSKGTVDMEGWRSLQETMGYALSETAKQLGIASGNSNELYSAIQSGQITFDQFNDALIECSTRTGGFAENAKAASAGIQTSFTNLGISITRGMANTIQSVDEAVQKIDGDTIADKLDSASGTIDRFFEGVSKGAGIAVQALDLLGPSIITVVAGFAALKAAMAVQNVWEEYHRQAKAATIVIEAFNNAEKLAADATKLRTAATTAAAQADKMSEMYAKASAKALESQAIAQQSALAATKARKTAEAAAAAETKVRTAEEKLSAATLKLKAAEEKAAASATKSKAVQEKVAAAVTRARADVDKKAAAVARAKAKMDEFGASSAELSAKAETMEAAATKAGIRADEDSIKASMAKTMADAKEAQVSKLNAAAETAKTTAEEAGNIVTAKSSLLVIAKTAVLGALSGQMGIAEAAQWGLNAAMTANPIGSLIVLATALVAVTAGVSKALSKLDKETEKVYDRQEKAVQSSKDLIESLDSTEKAYEDNVQDVRATAEANKELADNIAKLSEKENKSAQDKAELKAYVDSLNSSMEGLNLQYNSETDALNMTTDALKNKVEAYEAQVKAQAAQERYVEVMKEQLKVEEEQAALSEKRNQFEKEWQELNSNGPKAMAEYRDALAEMDAQSEELNTRKKELASSEEYLKGVMTESQAAQTEAITSGTQSQIISLQDLSETQQAVVQSMNETWQSYADQATNMFDTLSDDSELSVAEMTQNLLENQRVISEWATNIDTLAKRGINEGLLEQLRQAGPESAGYVNAMVQASDAELQALSEAFANGGETATNALKTVFDTSTVPESAMNLITKTQQTLNEQITAADFSSLGQNVGQGLSEGISSSSETAATAAGAMATGVNEAAANTLGVHSPSTVFMGYGQDLINGLVIGMQGQSGALNATMTMLMTSAGQAAANALNSQLNQMSNVTGASFTKIPAAAQSSMQMTAAVVGSGMSGVTQKITAGMKLSETATKSGMKAMNAAVKADMQTIKSSAESGMNAFENSINRGMNQSKNSVVRGGNSMVSAVRNIRSGFYSSGYYASAGLAQGINAGSGAAIAAANRLASQVAATMNRALKVGSPSRVTREIGGFTTEGFVLGILDDVRAVKRAAVQVAEAALPSGSIADRFAYAGAYVPDSRFEYTETMDATYTIIVPVILEGREVARVTAPYTEAELNKKQKVKNMIKGIKG
ncbi:tape measure protein [uncultured Merdimonas sp.]|uniref:tape measure protein n=1 Tax=uncultured Merdimonas sp. TaxID=2023269 RepID=UPI003207D290